MGLLRTFIAVDIPSHIQQLIQQRIEPLRKSLGAALVRWVAPESVHLTLKFLGDVAPANIQMLSQMLGAEADVVHAFDIHVNGLGCFPSRKRPRVLFIGIQAPAELEALYRGIDSACARLGYESDQRDFAPHLSIGRVRQDIPVAGQQQIRAALEASVIDALGTARVDSVHLYKSDLKPGGSVYTKLFSAPLKS
jgi:RNA 2',3'-cyclic 3'-phosphodiesterase